MSWKGHMPFWRVEPCSVLQGVRAWRISAAMGSLGGRENGGRMDLLEEETFLSEHTPRRGVQDVCQTTCHSASLPDNHSSQRNFKGQSFIKMRTMGLAEEIKRAFDMPPKRKLSECKVIRKELLKKMRPEKKLMLENLFSQKRPDPGWLEDILQGLSSVSTKDYVLSDIRNNPKAVIDYAANLAAGHYYNQRGLTVKFLPTLKTKNFDLEVDGKFAIEVKRLEDTSGWAELIGKISVIRSQYNVEIDTN